MLSMFKKKVRPTLEISEQKYSDFPESVKIFIQDFLLPRINSPLTDLEKAIELRKAALRACKHFDSPAIELSELDESTSLTLFLSYRAQKEPGGFFSSSSFHKSLDEVIDTHKDLSFGRQTETRKALKKYLEQASNERKPQEENSKITPDDPYPEVGSSSSSLSFGAGVGGD